MFYYIFWLKSSRGTNELTVRSYTKQPSQANVKEDIEEWCSSFGAWTHSENVCSYGWRQIKASMLPKNRREALKKFSAACKAWDIANLRKRVAMGLLNCPPFDGTKVKKYKCDECKDTGTVHLPPAFPRMSRSHTHVDCPKCFPPSKKK